MIKRGGKKIGKTGEGEIKACIVSYHFSSLVHNCSIGVSNFQVVRDFLFMRFLFVIIIILKKPP